MVKIQYGNNRNIRDLYFAGGWKGELYIDTVPKADDIKYINNVETKNGIEITKSKVVQEEHIMRFVAGETMVKVLQKLPLLSDITVKVDALQEDKVYNFKFEVANWIGGGAYAQCKITYAIKTYVDKNATINSYG